MSGTSNKTLILNVGSSGLKFRLYEKEKIILDKEISGRDFKKCFKMFFFEIEKHKKEISKVGYRVVYGGSFKSPLIANKKVLRGLNKLKGLDDLHMKNTLFLIRNLEKKLEAKHILFFDDTFHRTIPKSRKIYPIPFSISKKYKIEKYGFHGIAHESLFCDAQKFLGKKYKRVITCQIGSGVSLCAIKKGKSVETTMGFTPLEGLMMSTRSGSIDPSILIYLGKKGFGFEKIKKILEEDSGLKGISGFSDMRKILKRMDKDKKSKLAYEMFIYEVKKALGSYIALLGGVDLIVLGGGMSRAPKVRKEILENLEEMGIKINKKKIGKSSPVKISSGKVEVISLETDEEKLIFEKIKNL